MSLRLMFVFEFRFFQFATQYRGVVPLRAIFRTAADGGTFAAGGVFVAAADGRCVSARGVCPAAADRCCVRAGYVLRAAADRRFCAARGVESAPADRSKRASDRVAFAYDQSAIAREFLFFAED